MREHWKGLPCLYTCKDCAEAFPRDEVVHLATGPFMCLACWSRDKLRRMEHGLEPVKLMVYPNAGTALTYTDDGRYHGGGGM